MDAMLGHRPEQRFGEAVASPAADHQHVGCDGGVEQRSRGVTLGDPRGDPDWSGGARDTTDGIVEYLLCEAFVVDVLDRHREPVVSDDGLDLGSSQGGFAHCPSQRGLRQCGAIDPDYDPPSR